MKPKLLIVTGNAMKFKELSNGLAEFFDCEQRKLDEPEIQGTPEEIIKHKLKVAYEKFQQPVFVDDTSVHFEALNGFPGPYAKDFWKCFPPYEAGVKFAGTRMKVVNHIGLCLSEDKIILADGVAEGWVVMPKSPHHDGREFDLFFQVDGTDKPMLTYSIEEKNKFSHRGKAMKNLMKILAKDSEYNIISGD
jgi:non-canonical purine NTP pyrophosphatase (RdgB/HAM1 family)